MKNKQKKLKMSKVKETKETWLLNEIYNSWLDLVKKNTDRKDIFVDHKLCIKHYCTTIKFLGYGNGVFM